MYFHNIYVIISEVFKRLSEKYSIVDELRNRTSKQYILIRYHKSSHSHSFGAQLIDQCLYKVGYTGVSQHSRAFKYLNGKYIIDRTIAMHHATNILFLVYMCTF